MVDDRTETVGMESLGQAVAEVVDRARSGGPVVLTRNGRPVAAVLDLGRLETLYRERELLRRLALGELEAAAGEGDDLEAVLDDCALLLEES
jgi:prevent-host-death family protein